MQARPSGVPAVATLSKEQERMMLSSPRWRGRVVSDGDRLLRDLDAGGPVENRSVRCRRPRPRDTPFVGDRRRNAVEFRGPKWQAEWGL